MGAAWDRFWFARVPASTLGLVRIAFAFVVLVWAVSLAPDLATLFGPGGVVGGGRGHVAVYLILLAGAACMLVGYRTRASSAAVFGALLWFRHVDPWALNAGDAVLRHLALVLMLAPSGAALSLDRRRAPDRFERVPEVGIWSLRLIQLQLSAIYLTAVAAKLEGAAWRDGVAASLALAVPDATRLSPPELLTSSPAVAHVLTWGTIGLEAAIALLVWNRRLRPWVLGAGACFHLAVDLWLRAGFFSWAMLVCYLAFLAPGRVTARTRPPGVTRASPRAVPARSAPRSTPARPARARG